MFFKNPAKETLISPEKALKGRTQEMQFNDQHFVLKTPLKPPYPDGSEKIVVGLGCFWGAEKTFWSLPGIITTAVGYAAGYTPNPTYEEVCSGMTGHNEVVLIVFDPNSISLAAILKTFWESHNPTQGMQQGNDRGTQYRSGIYYYNDAQKALAEKSKTIYQQAIKEKMGPEAGDITTELLPAKEFYFSEDYHQQYLAKNPNGYCGLGGMGIACSI
ncbi:MAG: peptide-methionine (S)-S-oxide reductase MsrA [Cellvibrionaceae bacterium]